MRTCPRCGVNRRFLQYCEGCRALLPEPAGATAFERLGLKPSLDVEAAELERNFLELSRRLHPDFYASADAETQALSARHSAALNEAHRIVADPWSRASALLETLAPGYAPDKKIVPPGLLAETLGEKDELEEIQKDARSIGGVSLILDEKERRYRGRMRETFAKIEERFTQWAAAPETGRAERAREIQALLNSRNYYLNLLHEVERIRGNACGPVG